MKKVRFESPVKVQSLTMMEDYECHSPRPFTERQIYTNAPDIYNCPKVLPYSNDPVQMFESSNSSPYPTMNKTQIPSLQQGSQWSPSNDLELSMLDAGNHVPCRPTFSKSILKSSAVENNCIDMNILRNIRHQNKSPVPTVSEKKIVTPPNTQARHEDFFIKRDNLGKIQLNMNPIQHQMSRLSLDKENNPLVMKTQIVQTAAITRQENQNPSPAEKNSDCSCHHCMKTIPSKANPGFREQVPQPHFRNCIPNYMSHNAPTHQHNHCTCGLPPVPSRCTCCDYNSHHQHCSHKPDMVQSPAPKMNAIDKKTWAIEKYEQSKKSDTMEVERQTNIIKEKREPTVSDLFKIIKLQNEQLQLLQEKVDKFISASQQNHVPVQNCISEHVAIETVGNEQHKISIGVMTSFEMVRTSTIINKEVLKTNDNAQIQCNRSQISIKGVVSKSQSPNLNFLDGITPMGKSMPESQCNGENITQPVNEEKTFNELSLYNVQVDNATTPLMSPDQSLYLDVRDYSDSEADSDQSNVGWTYYNKVMTHVNGMLQDSDMPSSASALYRNTRQQMQAVQVQIDKTNVSVTKRVKFGDDPLGIHQPHIYAGSTDTSMKMNQLAAKYLKGVQPAPAPHRPPPKPTAAPIDMSFATRNYMERHKILQGVPPSSKSPHPADMPRFLDITALKQQPKFL
ncbi:anastral spindle 2 [Anticarsia gemmatalis]|uniref:anastral spindle 2 n=1 Tax=Anticarsia gemmatalis TaxID=129554 RepID=UPI003F75CDC8